MLLLLAAAYSDIFFRGAAATCAVYVPYTAAACTAAGARSSCCLSLRYSYFSLIMYQDLTPTLCASYCLMPSEILNRLRRNSGARRKRSAGDVEAPAEQGDQEAR